MIITPQSIVDASIRAELRTWAMSQPGAKEIGILLLQRRDGPSSHENTYAAPRYK